MAIIWSLIFGVTLWIALWAIGVKGFDAFLVLGALLLVGVTIQLTAPFVRRQLGRD